MYKVIILLILFVKLFANNTKEPSDENNFNNEKYAYQTNNKKEAIGATLLEVLYGMDKITKKKKLNTDFKYLDEFENSVHDK